MQLKLTNSKLPFAPLLLIAPFFFWGTAMVAMKGFIPQTTPFFMAAMRILPAGILLLLVGMIQGRPQPQGKIAWLWILLFALVDGALFQGFLAQGLVRTGAGLGSVMIDSQPLAVAILSLWLFQERIRFWGWLGLGIGVFGISLIGLPDEWIGNLLHPETIEASLGIDALFQSGEWLMLLASLSMAVGTVLVRWVCKYNDPVMATGWHLILGGVPLLALSAGFESGQWVNIDQYGWIAMGYAAIFGSAIAYGLFFYFASSGNLTSLSALTFLTPIFALLFGNLFLGEVLSSLQSVGVGLTLVSIYLINQRDVLAEKLKLRSSKQKDVSNTTTGKLLKQSQQEAVEVKVPVGVEISEKI
ncbi:MAG: DMT family transporter [Okeania sp. SIO2G4]|uniref:DMT family transporter n=1 Tax=unclassified Okeania TaxID=2634635 RepID=UPI0013BCF3F0|nr:MULTISPECIES: DMT family transporter [unclassified Okeania]NEP04446.1 DMT family transporter [Okeania sp. SIO4D6]NEP40975.1 DMT family transporter [Okeania sp. SIO2H7]NEP74563.1 DMT family transporter [Okeania sp. SIO2G5]NEP95623.1 DMT family transporter [Okeania sp. SIO2F5]NEQ92672.1 DMT family transporter [Okeania sp. SIO2G4]